MKSFNVVILFTALFLLTPVLFASSHEGHEGHSMALKRGRYQGSFVIGDRVVPAILDIFLAQKEDRYPELKAILKLSPGGFGSHEYLGYSFDKVYLDPASKTLSFAANGKDVLLTQVMVHGSQLMGQFYVMSAGAGGQFNLKHFKSYEDKLQPPNNEPPEDDSSCLPGEPCDPPEEGDSNGGGHGGGHDGGHGTHSFQPQQQSRTFSLAGTYEGSCAGENRTLQVDTERNSDGLEKVRSPFGQYRISARLGGLPQQSASNSKKLQILEEGRYNPFSGALSFSGIPRGLQCMLSVGGESLVCGSCTYTRRHNFADSLKLPSELKSHERIFKVEPTNYSALPDFPTSSQIRGSYKGYLHHELKDEYQAAEFNIETFYFTDKMHAPNLLYLNASLKLSVGRMSFDPQVIHVFEQRPWMRSDGAMVFEGESEGFGVVRSWRDGFIKMDWYSKNFGRVGTIELVRDQELSLPSTVKKFPLLSGSYLGPRYSIDLELVSVISGEYEVFNTSYGIEISGNIGRPKPGVKHHVAESTYDIYTGMMSLHLSNGSKLLGSVQEDGLNLFLSGVDSIGYPMMNYQFSHYQGNGLSNEEHSH